MVNSEETLVHKELKHSGGKNFSVVPSWGNEERSFSCIIGKYIVGIVY
jgi:hypothetical protein